MTVYGEMPEVGLEEPMTAYEIAEFRDTVLWRAVGFLWGGDFVRSSQPGEELSLTRKCITEAGAVRVSLEAYCWRDQTSVQSPRPIAHSLRIGIEESRPEMTRDLVRASGTEETYANYRLEVEQNEEAIIEAWETKHFFFRTLDEDPFFVATGFELQDYDGDTVWDDRVLDNSDDESEPAEEDEVLEAYTKELEESLTKRDCRDIETALVRLGVPAELFE